MAIPCRSLIRVFVLVMLVSSMMVQSYAKKRLTGQEKKLFSLENNYVQTLYLAARNCSTEAQYEKEVRSLLQDDKCPEDVLEDAHKLAMAIGDPQADLRIGDSLKEKNNPWTHSGRRAQGSLMYGTIWGLAGAAAWDMFGKTVKEFCRRMMSIETVMELLKKCTVG